jgi:hypothetical protein
VPLKDSTLISNDLRKSSAASRDFTLVVMTESSTNSPELDCVRVAAQAANVAISIRSTKKWITIFLFFIAVTPPCKFDCEMVHYETFSPDSTASFCKIFLDLLATLLSKYLTFSGKGPNHYNIFRP